MLPKKRLEVRLPNHCRKNEETYAWTGYLKGGERVHPPLAEAPQGQARPLSDVLSRSFFVQI
jgi:hypothetical protein